MSRRVSGRYPQAGACAIADKIRLRRGQRGLTPLDGTLLRVPHVADGWNSLLGAVRTKGNLPANVREAMILRVAAHNDAKFEWIHHEPVARDSGMSTLQLSVIRNTSTAPPPTSSPAPLTSLQAAAISFADASTKLIHVSDQVVSALTQELGHLVTGSMDQKEEQVQDLLVECAAVVATYNMVSRLLVSLDVAGVSNDPVPHPVDRTEHHITYPWGTLHAVRLIVDPTFPWLVFSNSILTDISLWSSVSPTFTSKKYNLLLFDHRGHGLSTLISPATCTIPDLADDIALLLDHLKIPTAHAFIGVSQGGATALSFALRHPDRIARIVACDTQAKAPKTNRKAWDDRVNLAREDGMQALALATARRWFPPGSTYHPEGGVRAVEVLEMIGRTPALGFEVCAGALQEYDLLAAGLLDCKAKTLLVAGEMDGALPGVLERLEEEWAGRGGDVKFVRVPGSGHLPMLDNPEGFLDVVVKFLEG